MVLDCAGPSHNDETRRLHPRGPFRTRATDQHHPLETGAHVTRAAHCSARQEWRVKLASISFLNAGRRPQASWMS